MNPSHDPDAIRTGATGPVDPADARLDAWLDDATAAVAADDPAEAEVDAAVARTWARLQGAGGALGAAGETDYRALIPAFLAGDLPHAQRVLVADHMRENPAFRSEVEAARTGRRRLELTAVGGGAAAPARPGRLTRGRLGAAAATLALAASVGAFVFARDTLQPNRVLAHVADVDGALVTLADADGTRPLAVGDGIRPRQALRAADGGAVVTLADGSRLELDDRTQIRLGSRWNGLAVRLDRGNVIVEASDQGRGRLVVDTDDLDIRVQGTIFSVRHGTKGTRVSVVEGAVEVRGAAGARRLTGGQQYVSNAAVGAVPVNADFSWSRDPARYRQLLAELAQIGDELDAAVDRPAPRTASALVGRLPADTAVVVALPNLGPTLAEQYALFESRVAAYPALAEWWAAHMADPAAKARLDALVEAVAAVGDEVGDEVVLSVAFGADGEPAAPVVLATVADPTAFRTALEARFADLTAQLDADDAADAPTLAIVTDRAALAAAAAAETAVDTAAAPDGAAAGDAAASGAPDAPAAPSGGNDRLHVWIGDGVVAASPAAASLEGVVAADGPVGAGFQAAIDGAYARGLDALVAVDLERIVDTAGEAAAADGEGDEAAAAIDFTGMDGARYLVLTQVERDGRSQFEAEATFDGPRTGAAAWLAAPGPMGALDFVSPDAYVAGAAVIAAPERIVAEFLGLAERMRAAEDGAGAPADADAAFAAEVMTKLAAGLGGEVAFAVDGPLLPKPAWKMIVEVDDAAVVQAAMTAAVEGLNARFADDTSAGGARLALGQADSGGRTIWTLTFEGGDTSDRPAIHYLFTDGYLVAAGDTPLLLQALKVRDSGVHLAEAPAFRAALPAGAETDFSALLWQDVARLSQALAGAAGAAGPDGAAAGDADAAAALSDLAGELAPSLVYAWADADRLRFAASSDMGPLGLGLLLRLFGGAAGDGPAGPDGAGPGHWPGLPIDVDVDAGGSA